MPQTVSVVIPVYNNQPTLAETCRRIRDIHQQSFPQFDLEIVCVNDGSTDGSWEELLGLQQQHAEVTLLNLSRNFGQLGALFAGFNHASGDAIITISADLQDPIALMGKMVGYWQNDTEIVICHREDRQDGGTKKLCSRLAYAIARRSSPELPPGGFDYWLMSRKVAKMLCGFKGRHNFLQGYLCAMGFSKAFIPYTREQRKAGRSGYSFGKKVKIMFDFLVDSSYLPIRAMSCLGLMFAAGGLFYSLLICYAWFINETPFPGWAPLMILLMIIGGMIMVMLGVIGEYIWRIYDNGRDFPLFIVEKKVGGRDQ